MATKRTPGSKKVAKPSASAKRSKKKSLKPKAALPKRKVKPAKPTTAKTKPKAVAPKKGVKKRAFAQTPSLDPSHPERNSDFPNTYLAEITASLDDPDHWVRLTWTGPKAAAQEVGPFHSSPGAGNKGTNCDLVATSQRSGSHCTPKGTRTVEGFARRLNSDSRAEYVTWFQQSRGIALHYFPVVPKYAASHGCVRLELKRVARLIQDNSRVGLTKVTVGGTWTKPAKQY